MGFHLADVLLANFYAEGVAELVSDWQEVNLVMVGGAIPATVLIGG